jgi:uncharacterized RDD family membrane protein YckC
MDCRYCRASNLKDEHRCHRCGRLLSASQPAPFSKSAAAPALQHQEEPSVRPVVAAAPPRRTGVFQPSLFPTRDLPRVVAIESFAPAAAELPRANTTAAPRRPRSRPPNPGQRTLDFDNITSAQVRAAQAVEPVIGCAHPVALPVHRMLAAAFDGLMIMLALAAFGGVFYLAGGEIALNKQSLALFALMAAVFALLYEILWCLADADTAGMAWAQLKLVDFDGRPPSREQRLFRVASGCVSLFSAGLGLLWALVDEESLTWHDHISKTFPTPN